MGGLTRTTPPPLDSDCFREAMSLLAAPLTIVTTRDATGRRWGFTASSVTSVSLDPPLVLVGLSNNSSCREAITESSEFVINVLGEQHRDVASAFASRGVDRFAGHDFGTWPDSCLPYLIGANAVFRCTTVDRIPVGDHQLLIGELSGLLTDGPTKPLLWYQREFCSAEPVVAADVH
ncbi:flavin reductase family protein [Kitasatospora sp. GP82]|uniref:flavin reductase family protein n=1 Tax=Kitasatospora sp. GP82 TaxID=3035089 RepID=UPI00247727A4|nr:flavin reductase family protein [Kitasatospora sp. GP82]MDH6124632.1 flavin reductase ActVB [Kitasatospora sp. GP82]